MKKFDFASRNEQPNHEITSRNEQDQNLLATLTQQVISRPEEGNALPASSFRTQECIHNGIKLWMLCMCALISSEFLILFEHLQLDLTRGSKVGSKICEMLYTGALMTV